MPPRARSRSAREESPNRKPFSAAPSPRTKYSFPVVNTPVLRRSRHNSENQPPDIVANVKANSPFSDASVSPALHSSKSASTKGKHHGSLSLPPRPPPPRPSPSTNLGRTGHDSQGHAKRKLNLDSTQCVDAPADSHLPCDQSKDDEHEKCTDQDNGVKVVVRVRPCNQKEEAEDATQIAEKISDETINLIDQTFTFDHVAGQDASQKAMFEMVGKPLVENCLEGFNSSIFAYGQTGSGKTYTMWGAIQDLMAQPPSEGRGLTPRVFEFLFERIKEEENKNADKQLRYQCRCSFFEIYNEQITDLLEPLQKSLQVREDTKTGVYVENLTEEFVSCPSEVFHLMTKGLGNRKIASTGMNIESSRSHTLFTCIIESRCKSMSDGISSVRTSRMNLVDLAGSERQKLTGAGGDRLREAGNINRSLSQLGNVINILAEVSQSGKPRHIPYRDSRLTFLLQESLGGNAKLAIICAISPASSCKNETLSTLRFAQRAKAIQNKAIVNEETEDDVKILREQIRQLKDELMRMKSNETMSGGAGCYSTSWNARRSYNLLRMSLSRPLTLPHTDTDSDEEMEIDEDAVEGSNDLSFLSTQAQSLVRALEIKEIKNGSCVSDTETLSNLCDGVAQALSASDSISTGDPAVSACSLDLHENFDIKDNVVNGEEKIVNNEELPEQGNFKLTWNSAQVNGENVEVTGFERRNLDEPLSSGGPGVLIDKELPEHEIPQLSQNHKEGKIGDEVTNFDKKNNVVDGEQNIVNNEELPEQGNIKLSWNSAQVNDENVEGTGFERRNFDEPHISGCPGILIHKELPEHEIPQLSQNHTDGKIGDEEVTGFQTSNGADVYMSEASFELAPNEFSKSLLANASLSINAPLNNIEVTCKRETKSVMFEDPDAHGVSVSNNSQTIKSGLTVQDDVPLLKECIKVDEDVVNLEPVCGIFEEPDSDIGPVSSNVPSSSFMPRMEDGDVCELSESPLNKESESEANVKGYFSVDTEAELTTESDKGTDKLPASACTPNEFEFDEASISTDAHCNEHQPAYIAHLDTVQVQTDVKDSCCTAVHSSGNSLRDPDADIVQHLFNKTECMTATNLDTTVINDGEQICESPEAHAQKNPDASRDQQHFSKIECLATKMPDVTVINNGEQICESAEIHDQEGLDQLTSDLKCTVIIDDVEDHHNLESPIVNPALNLSTVDLDGSVHNAECLTTETSDNMELDRGELDKETCTSTCANAEVHTLKLPVLSLSPRLPVIDLDAPILSMSPTLGDTTQGLHRSVSPPFIGVATADACQASNEKFEDAEEGIQFNGINDTVLRTSFIKMNSRATGNPSSSAQRLAASLHRGLQIIECHQKKANSSRMSTLRFSFQKSDWDKPNSRNMVNQSVQTSLTWLPDQAVEHRDVGSNASPVEQLLGECKPEHDEEELSTPQKRINLQTKTEMEALLSGALRRERAMEDDLQRKTAEIEQLNRLIRQYKHERECNAVLQQSLEDKIARLESLMDGTLPTDQFLNEEWSALLDEHKILQERYDHHPEVTLANIRQQRLYEDLEKYKNFCELGERDLLLQELSQLRNQLQYYIELDTLRPTKQRQRSVTPQGKSNGQEKHIFAESEPSDKVYSQEEYPAQSVVCQMCEKEAENWIERENEWMSVLEELRVEVEEYKQLAEKRKHEAMGQQRYANEMKDALEMAMEGHARLLDQYAELQEKHISFLAKHRKIKDAMSTARKKAGKMGFLGGGKWFEAQAAELMALKLEREQEKKAAKEQIEGLQAQLRDTADAVQAAGELLVRLKEAEETVLIAQDAAALAAQDAERLYREIDKLKRRHSTEVATLQQRLLEARFQKSTLCPMCVMAERVKFEFTGMEGEEADNASESQHHSGEQFRWHRDASSHVSFQTSRGELGEYDLHENREIHIQGLDGFHVSEWMMDGTRFRNGPSDTVNG